MDNHNLLEAAKDKDVFVSSSDMKASGSESTDAKKVPQYKYNSDDIARVVCRIQKNKKEGSVFANDNAFLGGSNKCHGLREKTSRDKNKKPQHPLESQPTEIDNNPLRNETMKPPYLGFSIKVVRIGERTEKHEGNNKEHCQFVTPSSSLVKSTGFFRKSAFPQNSEKGTDGDEYSDRTKLSTDLGGTTLNDTDGFPFPRKVTDEIGFPENRSGPSSEPHDSFEKCIAPKNANENKEKTRLGKRKSSMAGPGETNSWTHPKKLKKEKHQFLIVPTVDEDRNSAVKKSTQGGNFVKLNLNKRGSNLRKFISKGAKRKIGNRRYWPRRRKNPNDGNDGSTLKTEDVDIGDSVDEQGNCNKTKKVRSAKRESFSLSQDCVSSKTIPVPDRNRKFQNCSDKAALDEAVEKALKDPSDNNLLDVLKFCHGFNSFLSGQLETIKRILASHSTILVLPTGSGKSLCYQLAALILPGVTLVVSPLVALMIDQLYNLPPAISGAVLASNQTLKESADTLERLRTGGIKVLFVSPERLLSEAFLEVMESIPKISFVVIDEAHCLSEWSHNFRPSYFRLGAIFRKKLKVSSILAMTATATRKTLKSISQSLEISPDDVIEVPSLRENLRLSVSSSGNKMKDMLRLIKSSPFLEAESIIVYCKFQSEADLLSKFLRDNNIHAKSYHSSLPMKERTHVQEMFCCNKLRVVVATVAFGMGLDKKDVEAVIHYSLPGSLEQYVQETGRAGRDGRIAYCHLFLDETTYFKTRSLAYSDGTDEYAANKFLFEIFGSQKDSLFQIRSLHIEAASRKFDLKEEVMATILSYLETEEVQYLRVLPQSSATCSLCFHKSSPFMLAKENMLVNSLLKRFQCKHGQYAFDIPALANCMGMNIPSILSELGKLQLKGEITYELKDPAFFYVIHKIPENIVLLSTNITCWLNKVEVSKVQKIDAMYSAAIKALNTPKQDDTNCILSQQECLQSAIKEYFSAEDCCNTYNLTQTHEKSPFLRADIKVFLQNNSELKFSPRAVARIMHGLSSPAYPSSTWSKNHFWGRYVKLDFDVIKKVAASEMMSLKIKS